MKLSCMTVFKDVVPCSLVETDWCFRGVYCLMIEAVSTSQTLVNFYHTSWCNIPEDSHLHTRHCENLKSHVYKLHPWHCKGTSPLSKMNEYRSKPVSLHSYTSDENLLAVPFKVQTFHLNQSIYQSINPESPSWNVLDNFTSKLHRGQKSLIFISILDSWGWVNLNEICVSITDICIQPHNFSSQLTIISHVKHFFKTIIAFHQHMPNIIIIKVAH
jgi:hypothetical protein